MIHGINHVAISTGDIEVAVAVAFYCDLLGFEEVFSLNWQIGD